MKSAITRVNESLARAGRKERVIRARDYYRLSDGESHTFREAGLYALGARLLDDSERDFGNLLQVVQWKLEENGVAAKLERLWQVGDVVDTLFDTGGGKSGGPRVLYGEVVEAGPNAAKIVWESGLSNRVEQLRAGIKLARDPEYARAEIEKYKRIRAEARPAAPDFELPGGIVGEHKTVKS